MDRIEVGTNLQMDEVRTWTRRVVMSSFGMLM